jgi:hypothetical protein
VPHFAFDSGLAGSPLHHIVVYLPLNRSNNGNRLVSGGVWCLGPPKPTRFLWRYFLCATPQRCRRCHPAGQVGTSHNIRCGRGARLSLRQQTNSKSQKSRLDLGPLCCRQVGSLWDYRLRQQGRPLGSSRYEVCSNLPIPAAHSIFLKVTHLVLLADVM